VNNAPYGAPRAAERGTGRTAPPKLKCVEFLLVLVAAVGAAVGLAAGVAFRISDRTQRTVPPMDEGPVPPGVERVLGVLSASAVVLDNDLHVVRASPSAYALGIVQHEVLAVPTLVDLATHVRRDGRIRQGDLEISRGRGTTHTRYVHARVAPLSTDRLLVLVEDRTQAHRIDEVRRDFVANVSHELKTPIGAISLLAEAVEDARDDPEAVHRFAARMKAESERLGRLVQEIIDLSRLQSDDPLDSPEPIVIDTIVEEAIDRSRVDAEAKRIRLTWGGTKGLEVLGNPVQLAVALGNLVENAVAYSSAGGRVAVGVRQVEDLVELTVTDHGIGIPSDEQQRIFERFYRVDPARSRATGGTGLGLSIVKHVIASHGGEISVWSVPGTGSTFTVRLPLHRPEPRTHTPDSVRAAS
jgi:two-component system, OmpR family, sensor histidine kinase SenX3